LMESYRTERGPRQRIVAYLGQLDGSHRLGVKNAAEGNSETRQKQHHLQRMVRSEDFQEPRLATQQLANLGERVPAAGRPRNGTDAVPADCQNCV
jgi:hypothetical protein